MLGISSLQTTRSQLEADYKSKQARADEMRRSAETHRANGNDVQADLDEKSADKFQTYADEAKNRETAIVEQIRQLEDEKNDIQRKIDDLDKNYKQDRDQLQSELQKVA